MKKKPKIPFSRTEKLASWRCFSVIAGVFVISICAGGVDAAGTEFSLSGHGWSKSGTFPLTNASVAETEWIEPEISWSRRVDFERRRQTERTVRLHDFVLNVRKSKHGQLLDLVSHAEVGAEQYDSIHLDALILPASKPILLSLLQILEWVEATPGQPHAVGRYQLIPNTLPNRG